MVEKVIRYKADDGEIYDTEKEAEYASQIYRFGEQFPNMFSYNNIEKILLNKDKIVQFLTNLNTDQPIEQSALTSYLLQWCSILNKECKLEENPDCKACEIGSKYTKVIAKYPGYAQVDYSNRDEEDILDTWNDIIENYFKEE